MPERGRPLRGGDGNRPGTLLLLLDGRPDLLTNLLTDRLDESDSRPRDFRPHRLDESDPHAYFK